MSRIGKKDKHSSKQQNADSKSLKKSTLARVQTKLEKPSRCAQLSTRSNESTKTLKTLDLSYSIEESPSPVRPLPSKKWSFFLDSPDESDASVESHPEHLSNIDNESAGDENLLDNGSDDDFTGDVDSLDGEEVATPTISKISTSKIFQDDRYRGPKTPNPLFGGNLKPDESDSEFSMDECSLDIDTTQKATETKIEFKDIQQSDHSSSRKKSVDRSSTSTASTLEMKLVNGIMKGLNGGSDNEAIVHDEESIFSEEREENSMSTSSTNVADGSKRDLSRLFQTRDERNEPYDIAKAKLIKHLGLIEHKCTEGSPKLVFIKPNVRKLENFLHIDRRYKACEDYFVDKDFREFLEKNGWVGPRKRKERVDLKNYDKDVEENIKYYEDSGKCKKEQEEKQRKKMKRTGNEKAIGSNLSQKSVRGKVSKQNQRVNKKSKRIKRNPPSSKKKKLIKTKEVVPNGGKRRGVQRKGWKFTSKISFGKPFYLGMFKLQTDAAMCHDLAATFLNRECKTKKCKNFANEEEYEIARQNEVQMANDKCEEQIEFPRPKFPDEAFLRKKFGLDTPEKTGEVDGFARVTRRKSKVAAKRREDIIEILSSDEEGADDENTNDQSFIVNQLSTDENQSPTMTQGQRYGRIGSFKAGDDGIQSMTEQKEVSEMNLAQTNSEEGAITMIKTENDASHHVLKCSLVQILGIPLETIEGNEHMEEKILEYCTKLFDKGCWSDVMLISCLKGSSEKDLDGMIDFMQFPHKMMVKIWLKKQRKDG